MRVGEGRNLSVFMAMFLTALSGPRRYRITIKGNDMNLKRSTIAAACAVGLGMTAVSASAADLYFDFNKNTIGATANASLFLFGNVGQTASVTNLAGFSQNVTFGANGFSSIAIPNGVVPKPVERGRMTAPHS